MNSLILLCSYQVSALAYFRPTLTHCFFSLLGKKGILQRIYVSMKSLECFARNSNPISLISHSCITFHIDSKHRRPGSNCRGGPWKTGGMPWTFQICRLYQLWCSPWCQWLQKKDDRTGRSANMHWVWQFGQANNCFLWWSDAQSIRSTHSFRCCVLWSCDCTWDKSPSGSCGLNTKLG